MWALTGTQMPTGLHALSDVVDTFGVSSQTTPLLRKDLPLYLWKMWVKEAVFVVDGSATLSHQL